MKTYFCEIERKQITLPTNLNNDNRGRYGKWRYKGPDGLKTLGYYVKSIGGKPFDSYKEIDSDTAIELAHRLNAKHYNMQPEQTRTRIVAGTLPYYIEQYIAELEHTDPDGDWKNKKHWNNQKLLLLEFGRAMVKVPMNKITLPLLENWWMTMGEFADNKFISPSSQRKRKPAMAKLFAWLMRRELVPALKGNPFQKGSDYEFPYRVMKKKQRQRLTLDAFLDIQKAAEDAGEHMLVTAMSLALFTKLRREDLCQLTFDECLVENNTIFRSKISKWENQHEEEVWNEWKLAEHPDLQTAITRARTTRLTCFDWKTETHAPYILHKNFRTHHLPNDAKTKNHPTQVTGDYLGKLFSRYRDANATIAKLPTAQKPTFHEIRGLSANLELKSGCDLAAVSESMNHSDTDITESYYTNNHETKIIHVHSRIDLEKVAQIV